MSEKTRKNIASLISVGLLLLAGLVFGWTIPVALIAMVVGGFAGAFLSYAVAALVGWLKYRRRIRRLMAEARRLDAILAELDEV